MSRIATSPGRSSSKRGCGSLLFVIAFACFVSTASINTYNGLSCEGQRKLKSDHPIAAATFARGIREDNRSQTYQCLHKLMQMPEDFATRELINLLDLSDGRVNNSNIRSIIFENLRSRFPTELQLPEYDPGASDSTRDVQMKAWIK